MQWVSRIFRDESEAIAIETQDKDGKSRISDFGLLAPELPVGSTNEHCVTFDLRNSQVFDTARYLAGLELEHLSPSGQVVYVFDTVIGRLVIPAQMLICNIAAPRKDFRQHLVKPWSLGMLTCTQIDDDVIGQTAQPYIDVRDDEPRRNWMTTYPSASVMWSSVYRNLLAGQLDVACPAASVHATVRIGACVDGALLVTKLVAFCITPHEEPHPFASGRAPKFFLVKQPRYSDSIRFKTVLSQPDSHVENTRPAPLTDAEWQIMEERLLYILDTSKGGRPRTYSLRQLVEVIRLVFIGQVAWNSVPVEYRLAMASKSFYTRLWRSPKWEEVRDTLGITDYNVARPNQLSQTT